jgi:hypothetical protein
MAELSTQQIADLYSRIESLDDTSMKKIIENEIENTNYLLDIPYKFSFPAGVILGKEETVTERKKSITTICISVAKQFRNEIWDIAKYKNKTTEYFIDIIQVIAPAIAQQYSGIPAMAIVAALTIMCRKGIFRYLRGEIHEL